MTPSVCVHCRIGSLEMWRLGKSVAARRSLSHRQLKKWVILAFGIGQLTKRSRGIRNAWHFRYALILLVFSAMR